MSTLHISPFRPRERENFDLATYYRDRYATLSRVELEFLSEADGLSRATGKYVYVKSESLVEVHTGGSLVKVSTGKAGSAGPSEWGGIRGAIVTFSSASRRRLMRLIASTARDIRPIFATLTYPDVFDDDAAKWKRDLDAFGKRFRREFPTAAFVWRIEFKTRKTGKSEGDIAPHFHLLAWGVSMAHFKPFVSPAWYSVVGSGSSDHAKAGTSCERIKSFNGLMRYVSKYIAKVDEMPKKWVGRLWGVVGRDNMPIGVILRIQVSDDVATRLVRLGRKMIKAKGKTLTFGLTWIMNGERLLDYIEYLDKYG